MPWFLCSLVTNFQIGHFVLCILCFAVVQDRLLTVSKLNGYGNAIKPHVHKTIHTHGQTKTKLGRMLLCRKGPTFVFGIQD